MAKGKSRKRVASPKPDKGKNLREPHAGGKPSSLGYPVFCMRHLQKGFDVKSCDKSELADLARKMHYYSQMTWHELMSRSKHKGGMEAIPKDQVRSGIPKCITPDVKLWAIRFSSLKPMVGWKKGDVFHIVWLDRAYSLYKHE